MNDSTEDTVNGDPSVPTELLELHLELEDSGITAEEFKEAYGNESDSQS